MDTQMIDLISNTEVSSRKGEDPRDGKYLFAVERVISKVGQEGQMVIAELRVLESMRVVPNIEPNVVGSTVRFLQKLEKFKSAKANVRKFVTALVQKRDDEISPKELRSTLADMFSEEGQKEQPCRGMLIRGETFHQPNEKGEDRIYLRFSPVKDQGDIAARAKSLDN